jgi:predicted pyridoxine 5'-phosphate oxidase superfamily flavin-nucleotide-binding protein
MTMPGGIVGDRGRSVFHEGERAVQRRAGVERVAAQVVRNVLPYVPVEFGEFLSH